MTILNLIKESASNANEKRLSLQEIYQLNQILNRNSIRSSLRRAVKNKQIFRYKNGDFRFKKIEYQEFLHAKRIYDTYKSDVKHAFDLDLEFTCKGYAPNDLSISQIESIVNPKLLDAALLILNHEGIYLFEQIIEFRVTGSEWMTSKKREYDNTWYVEVKMINNVGVNYTFHGSFNVEKSEWQ